MKKIIASQDITLMNIYKQLLEDNNIAATIKNYYLTSGIGDLPPNECVPELWILDDHQFEQAKALLKPEKNTAWQCDCGENIEGEFAQCWKCGKVRES
ncbi:MAG: DUF2007 domain-containing protein [Gammaproteobacteria bacterium]|nr:DUF2007 domain-containing protein [Gammaproteobacteria bacterium]